MRSGRLVLAALALAAVTRAENPKRGFVPAPQRPPAKAPAPVNDPSEPPVKVEAAYDDFGRVADPAQARRVAAAGSARGPTLTLDTPGWYKGSALLIFKDGAPPMRFTMRLARLHELDLESLSLSSGRLSLHVGPVTTGATTTYFDARGREQKSPEGAAYTVTARRWGGGVVDVQLRRAPGATLPGALTVSWKGILPNER